MSGAVSKHHPLLAFGRETVTISKLGCTIEGMKKIEKVVPVLGHDLVADVRKSPVISIKIADDKKSFNIYCWKSTAAGDTTLIAATAAVNVDYMAFGEPY